MGGKVSAVAGSLGLRQIARGALALSRDTWMSARYAHRDFWLAGPSRRSFSAHPPQLNSTQARVVRDLTERGFSLVHFDELFGDPELWARLQQGMDGWVNTEPVQAGIRKFREEAGKPSSGDGKEYLLRQFPITECPRFPLDYPWLQVPLNARVLDTVNSYLGMWTKLHYMDTWYTIPSGTERPETASQQWHRDYEDYRLCKVFLYFSDVDEGAGPLQYIPGSRRTGGRYGHLWRRWSQLYPPQHQLAEAVPASEWVTCTGPPGTFVFVDTSGFHRGGFATERERIFSTWTFKTPASWAPRRFQVDMSHGAEGLSEAARFALE
jgi:hypothetical protein